MASSTNPSVFLFERYESMTLKFVMPLVLVGFASPASLSSSTYLLNTYDFWLLFNRTNSTTE